MATLACHPLPVVSLWNYVYAGSLFPKKEKRETRVKLVLIFISFIPLLFLMIQFFFFLILLLEKQFEEKKFCLKFYRTCLRKIILERARTSFQTRYRFVKKGVFSGKVLHSQMYSKRSMHLGKRRFFFFFLEMDDRVGRIRILSFHPIWITREKGE